MFIKSLFLKKKKAYSGNFENNSLVEIERGNKPGSSVGCGYVLTATVFSDSAQLFHCCSKLILFLYTYFCFPTISPQIDVNIFQTDNDTGSSVMELTTVSTVLRYLYHYFNSIVQYF